MRNKFRVLTATGAAAVLCIMARRIGIADIATQFSSLRVTLPIVMLACVVRLLLQTRAWRVALLADGIDMPQPRLFAVRLVSQAAGYLTVLGPAASEPTKLVLLRNASGAAAAAPATLVETGAYWFTTVLLGLGGAIAAAFVIADWRVTWSAAILFGIALAALATKRSVLPSLVGALGKRAPKWLGSAAKAELDIRSFRDRHRAACNEVLALDAAAQIVTLFEVFAVLWAAGIHVSPVQVLVIEAAGRMVKILGAWIPGRIGADEGGAAASFALLGLTPAAGLMLAMARRLRDLLCCAAGLVWAAQPGARTRSAVMVRPVVSLDLEENTVCR